MTFKDPDWFRNNATPSIILKKDLKTQPLLTDLYLHTSKSTPKWPKHQLIVLSNYVKEIGDAQLEVQRAC